MANVKESFNEKEKDGPEAVPYIIVAKHRNGEEDIVVKDLTVSIPGHNGFNLVEHVDLTIKKGDKVIMTGASGSGKTTVAKAILNQWDDGSGLVVMPKDVKIMALSQQAYFPNTTIRNILNIAPDGKGNYTDEELTKVLQHVHHDKLIQHIPGQQVKILMDGLLEKTKKAIAPYEKVAMTDEDFASVKEEVLGHIGPMIAEQFNFVQYTPKAQRDYFRKEMDKLFSETLDKPLPPENMDDLNKSIIDHIDMELARPLYNHMTKPMADVAKNGRSKLVPMTSAKASYMLWNFKRSMRSKLQDYMANDDTDDQEREIRINASQAEHIIEGVTKKLEEEMKPYVRDGILSQAFNAVTWPLSLMGLAARAKGIAHNMIQSLTFFMDRQVVTGDTLTLSGGERQKLMIAMVALHKPDILILDEITAALDRPTAEKLYREMLEEIPDETTVISIAHNEHIMKYHTVHAHLHDKTITLSPIEPQDPAAAPEQQKKGKGPGTAPPAP